MIFQYQNEIQTNEPRLYFPPILDVSFAQRHVAVLRLSTDFASSRKCQYISSMELKIRWYLELSGSDSVQVRFDPSYLTRWWQLKYFLFSTLFGEDEPILTHSFQMG